MLLQLMVLPQPTLRPEPDWILCACLLPDFQILRGPFLKSKPKVAISRKLGFLASLPDVGLSPQMVLPLQPSILVQTRPQCGQRRPSFTP